MVTFAKYIGSWKDETKYIYKVSLKTGIYCKTYQLCLGTKNKLEKLNLILYFLLQVRA